jgi:ATP-dependent helicase/nuclease subunit A
MPKLKDEQNKAVLHDEGDILVSASAGSGKTFTMIERAKRLIIEKGVDVSEILAVTFTEAAAFDMKEKLKKALAENADGENKGRLLAQLAEIPTADISTLHSFCGRLIRQYFFIAGVSPDFKIIDEAEAAVLRAESVDKAFK